MITVTIKDDNRKVYSSSSNNPYKLLLTITVFLKAKYQYKERR